MNRYSKGWRYHTVPLIFWLHPAKQTAPLESLRNSSVLLSLAQFEREGTFLLAALGFRFGISIHPKSPAIQALHHPLFLANVFRACSTQPAMTRWRMNWLLKNGTVSKTGPSITNTSVIQTFVLKASNNIRKTLGTFFTKHSPHGRFHFTVKNGLALQRLFFIPCWHRFTLSTLLSVINCRVCSKIVWTKVSIELVSTPWLFMWTKNIYLAIWRSTDTLILKSVRLCFVLVVSGEARAWGLISTATR